MVDVDDEAPDFELPDQTGQPVRLSDYRDKRAVLLVFYPLTFTGVPAEELGRIRDRVDVFRTDDVETLAVSVDAPPAHRVWAEQEGFDFPLLADFWPHGDVARRYGVLDEDTGVARPATFLVGRDGIVGFREVGPVTEPRDPGRWLAALDRLAAD